MRIYLKYLLLFFIISILSFIMIIFYYFQQYRDIGWFSFDYSSQIEF